jgi:nitrogen fixation/metabolism regulation signal transduction histidine kinase
LKQIKRSSAPALYTMPFLALVFVLIVVSSYLLAESGFEGVFSATIFNTPRGILFLVAGPLALLIFLGLFLYSIIADSLHSGGAGRFSIKIFLSIAVLLFSATLPQTVIICRFVGTAVGSWYDRSVSESLLEVEDIANLYTAERVRSMEKVADRFFTGLSITAYRSRQVDWMSDIRQIDSHAVACQVYAENRSGDNTAYIPVIETGDSGRFVPRKLLGQTQNGLYVLQDERNAFRYGRTVRYSDSVYICVYTSDIPEGFTGRLERIRSTRSQARIIDTLKPYLPLMGIWVFAMFILPSIMMSLIIAFHVSRRLSEPVRAIAVAVERLSRGDSSWRIVPRAKDETGEIARLVNTVAASANAESGAKKADKKATLRL